MTYSEYEAILLRGRRQLPVGHPIGLDYDVDLDGWDGREYSPPPNVDDDLGSDEVDAAPEVGYLTEEDILQYRPARYARSEPAQGNEQIGYPLFGYTPMPFPLMVSGYPVAQETDVIRRFLLEVGLPEGSLRGGRGDLVSYLRDRLGM